MIKEAKDITACIVDYGTFVCLAEKLSETYKKVYYYTSVDDEFRDAKKCIIGDGIENIERIDEFITPEIISEVDLFIFPDIGFGGTQKYLKSIGKAVWGSMGFDEFELYRTRFLKLLKELDLPIIPYKTVVGLSELMKHLEGVENKWIKINRYRENMETWHHLDYDHSERMFEQLALELGGVKEQVTFIVQDDIETDIECGYDGWCIDGQFPEETMCGYEKKNELSLMSHVTNKQIAKQVRTINEKLAPVLKEYGYRNFFATEIRVKGDKAYFIDPTPRMPGMTGEQFLETCSNLAEIIWKGANGEMVKPVFVSKFVAEATLHYTDSNDVWRTLRIPKEVKRWVKLSHHCEVDGVCHSPEKKDGEYGVVLGVGKTIEQAIVHLKKNMEALKDEPITIRLTGFDSLLKSIKKAQKAGIYFTDQAIPPSDIILK